MQQCRGVALDQYETDCFRQVMTAAHVRFVCDRMRRVAVAPRQATEENMSEQTTPEHGAPQQGTPSEPTTAGEHGFGVDEDNHGWAPDAQSSGKTTGAGRKAWEANDTQDAAPRRRRLLT